MSSHAIITIYYGVIMRIFHRHATWVFGYTRIPPGTYNLYFAGASKGNPGRSSWGWVLVDQNNHTIKSQGGVIPGVTTNHVANYKGLINALIYLETHGKQYTDVTIKGNSKLVVHQVNGDWICQKDHLQPFHVLATKLLNGRKLVHIRRGQNSIADKVCNDVLRNRN